MELEARDTKIPPQIVEIWQRIVDSMSALLSVLTVMINRLEPPDLEVFRSNISRDNPLPSGTRMPMLGIYCETTARTRQRNQFEDAGKDTLWANSPAAKAGIFSYLGFPVFWPSAEVFRTICAIDTKANKWLSPSDTLLETVKDAVEAHLALVATLEELDKKIRIWNSPSARLKPFRDFCPYAPFARRSAMTRGIGIKLKYILRITLTLNSVMGYVRNVQKSSIRSLISMTKHNSVGAKPPILPFDPMVPVAGLSWIFGNSLSS